MVEFLLGIDVQLVQDLQWAAPTWKIGTGIGLALLTWVALWWSRPTTPKKGLELSLWFSVLGLLSIMNSEPQLVSESSASVDGKTIVVLDHSASMSVMSKGQSRFERAEKILAEIRETIGGDFEVWHMGGGLQKPQANSTWATESDVLQVLHGLKDRYLGEEVRGVVLLTDGIDRGVLSQTLDQVPTLPGPLNVVVLDETKTLFDQSITSVETGGYAFQRMNFEIHATIQGMPNTTVTVNLRKNNDVADTQETVLDDNGVGQVDFTVRPLDVGRFAWDVSIPVDPRDVIPSNNYFPVVLKVVRDEVRVLQVSGSPSYDQKFLRLFLKQDPSVDLISFFILRTHADLGNNWSQSELSLIAFPYERLFTEELETFDLVIFQNFNHKPYFGYQSDELLDNIAEYVKRGGAFAMIGGDRSFDLGEYANTPIEQILPVMLGATDSASELKFQPQLTLQGAGHPLIRLASSDDENRRLWEELPEMDGFNRISGLVDGAASLLQHPTAKDDRGQPHSVLSVREVEKGRVMAVNVDSSWRWSYSEALEGGGNQAYLRFWKNAIRWLIADPEDAKVVILPSKENNLVGEEMLITVRSRDTQYQPLGGQALQLTIQQPSGDKVQQDVRTNDNGELLFPFTPEQQGVYQVRVTDSNGTVDVETVFAASSRMKEMEQVTPNPSLMSILVDSMAASGSIAQWMLSSDLKPWVLNTGVVKTVPKRTSHPIATAPLWFILLAPMLAMVVWIRRQNGGR